MRLSDRISKLKGAHLSPSHIPLKVAKKRLTRKMWRKRSNSFTAFMLKNRETLPKKGLKKLKKNKKSIHLNPIFYPVLEAIIVAPTRRMLQQGYTNGRRIRKKNWRKS